MQEVLKVKYGGPQRDIYSGCAIFTSPKQLLHSDLDLDAVFIGVPPSTKGSLEDGKDIELMFVQAGINCFVESHYQACTSKISYIMQMSS